MACYTLQVTNPDALPWATREVDLPRKSGELFL